MNCNTGEIISFEDNESREDFFRKTRDSNFVPLKDNHFTLKELDKGKVENNEVRELLCQIGRSQNAPRGVRRRLEKKLFKLRKKEQ